MNFSSSYLRLLYRSLPVIGVGVGIASTTTVISFKALAQEAYQFDNVRTADGQLNLPQEIARIKVNDCRAVQIIDPKTLKLNVNAVNSVLSKVGDSKFAVISVNGPKREGKSFLLSYFLSYLNAPRKQKSTENWLESACAQNNGYGGFEWRRGEKSCTSGIMMWNEPFKVIRSDGSAIYVILLDCAGSFDQKSDMGQITILFTISSLLSSVSIFNVMKQIEDKMWCLQLFADFATAVRKTASSKTNSNENSGNSCGNMFQKLIILVRDFVNYEDYSYGYHSDSEQPVPGANFKRDKINTSKQQSEEVRKNRKQIEDSFEELTVYLMPSPGLKLQLTDKTDELKPEFKQYLRQFIESVLNPDAIETKKVNGQELTGNEFKAYVEAYGKLDWDKDKPYTVKSVVEANKEANYLLAQTRTLKKYKEAMEKELKKGYQTREALAQTHEKIREQIVEEFQTQVSALFREGEFEILKENFDRDIEEEYRKLCQLNQLNYTFEVWGRKFFESLSKYKPHASVVVLTLACITHIWGIAAIIPGLYWNEIANALMKGTSFVVDNTTDYIVKQTLRFKNYIVSFVKSDE